MTKQPSCSDDSDPSAISVEQAKQRIAQHLQLSLAIEQVPIREALGRILAQSVTSAINVPSCTNSAMDGYAANTADAKQYDSLSVVGEALAGKPYTGKVASGECIRIMTGACIPKECDTVIMQEHVDRRDDRIVILQTFEKDQNIRQAGEDIACGQAVFSAGTEIFPAHLGVLASIGAKTVPVFEKLKVAYFSTGDELRPVGDTIQEGQIYDSNRYSLFGALSRIGVDTIDAGIVTDNRQSIRQCLQELSSQAHVIITTGGVSVGDVDYVKEEVDRLGELFLWKIAMKPGKPLAFGKINSCYFFGLPGNPVSVLASFYQFVLDALNQLRGSQSVEKILFQVPSHSKLKKRKGRLEYQRGILFRDAAGNLRVKSTGAQGSGILHSMTEANCFIILDVDTESVSENELVWVQAFYALV